MRIALTGILASALLLGIMMIPVPSHANSNSSSAKFIACGNGFDAINFGITGSSQSNSEIKQKDAKYDLLGKNRHGKGGKEGKGGKGGKGKGGNGDRKRKRDGSCGNCPKG